MRPLGAATRETGVFQCRRGNWSSNWLRRLGQENHDCDAHEDANSHSNSETRQEVFTHLPLDRETGTGLSIPPL